VPSPVPRLRNWLKLPAACGSPSVLQVLQDPGFVSSVRGVLHPHPYAKALRSRFERAAALPHAFASHPGGRPSRPKERPRPGGDQHHSPEVEDEEMRQGLVRWAGDLERRVRCQCAGDRSRRERAAHHRA